MAFIQVDQALLTHRKTLRLARLLGLDRFAVTGRLVALWTWCLDNALSGCLAEIEPDILADVMGWEGKPAELVEGLLTAGFLEVEDGRLWIHDWAEWMGRLIEKREANRERMRSVRAREREEHLKRRQDAAGPTERTVEGGDIVTDGALHVQRTFAARADARVEKSRAEYPPVVTSSPESKENAREDGAALSVVPAPAGDVSPGAAKARPIARVVKIGAKIGKARSPDPLWDACVVSMGQAPSNRNERGKWNTGVASLRESGATVEEIAVRCQRFRKRFGPSIPLNPRSLAGNWTELREEVTDGRHEFSRANRRSATSSRPASRSGHSARPDISAPDYYSRPVAAAVW